MIFRYSTWDILGVLVIPFHLCVFLMAAIYFESIPIWGLIILAFLFVIFSLQASSANHNHFHTPFFNSSILNDITRIGFSIISAPKTPQNIAHGLHHAMQYSWNEMSLLALLGIKSPLLSQVVRFLIFVLDTVGIKHVVFLVLLKIWPVERVAKIAAPDEVEFAVQMFKKICTKKNMRSTELDVFFFVAFRMILLAINWKFFVIYFIVINYVIDTIRQGENYYQHWGATDPMDPMRDSVSCYNKIYNLITFNLGYHQEHHYRPGVHWLKLEGVRKSLPNDRRIVPIAHYVNIPVFYPYLAESLRIRRDGEPIKRT